MKNTKIALLSVGVVVSLVLLQTYASQRGLGRRQIVKMSNLKNEIMQLMGNFNIKSPLAVQEAFQQELDKKVKALAAIDPKAAAEYNKKMAFFDDIIEKETRVRTEATKALVKTYNEELARLTTAADDIFRNDVDIKHAEAKAWDDSFNTLYKAVTSGDHVKKSMYEVYRQNNDLD